MEPNKSIYSKKLQNYPKFHCLYLLIKEDGWQFAKQIKRGKGKEGGKEVALFDISLSNIDCRYIDTFEKYRYRYGHF